jgi:SAM-dependent methyltransferase
VTDLISHYDRKYAGERAEQVRPVRLTDKPSDRFEAALHLALLGRRVLEVGPGSGRVMLALADRADRVVGVELSPRRAGELSRLFEDRPNVRIVAGDIDQVALEEGSFDIAIMSAVIEHLLDPISTLKKVHGLLEPGGSLVVDTPNVAKWTRRVKLAVGRFPSTASVDEGLLMYDRRTSTDVYDEGHLHYFTFRSLERVLRERVGFARVRRFGYGGPLARQWPTVFSECYLLATRE